MTPPLADKACGLAMVATRPALGGEQLRATFPRTREEVGAEVQPGRSLQLAPRPREAGWDDWNLGWKAGWKAGWDLGWKAGWDPKARGTRGTRGTRDSGDSGPPRVLQLLPLLAPPPRVFQAVQLAAKVPVRQDTRQQLYPPQTTQRLNPPQTTQRLSPMQTTQRLQPPPRVVVHGRAGEPNHTYLLGVLQCTGSMRKRANDSRHRRAMPTQRRPRRGERGLLERIPIGR